MEELLFAAGGGFCGLMINWFYTRFLRQRTQIDHTPNVIECPICHTAYTAEWLGLNLNPQSFKGALSRCVCGITLHITPKVSNGRVVAEVKVGR